MAENIVLPYLSVVMPVYNAQRFLPQAIESILKQTFADFEFIIVNDCSTDDSLAIIQRYQKTDSRIVVCNQPQNMGVVYALNQGCAMARGTFIARMDSDDISLPLRFEKQVQFLDEHLDVGVLGTSIQYIDADDRILQIEHMLTAPNMVGWMSLFTCSLAHPSVMFRRTVIQDLDYYDVEMRHAEDYELWSRALNVTKIMNLPDVLFQYRRSGGALTVRNKQAIEQTVIGIVQETIGSYLGIPISQSMAAALRSLIGAEHGVRPTNLAQIDETADLLTKLYRKFIENHQLTLDETNQISSDMALKMQVLAVAAFKQSPITGLQLFVNALMINRQSVFTALRIALAKLRS